MSKKTDEYAAALDKLERMRASGEVSQGRYDVPAGEPAGGVEQAA